MFVCVCVCVYAHTYKQVAEARFRYQVSPCGIYGGQGGTWTGFPLYTSVFSSQYH